MRRALAAVFVVSLLDPTSSSAACDAGQVDIRGPFGSARFAVEIADDAAERAQGLMWRESLPRFAGMLFIYEETGPVSFWMMNTLIPLDIVYIGETGRVVRVHPQAVPGDLTPMPSGEPVRAVLEINGGLAAALGIAPGAEVRHPAFSALSPVWPCA